MKSNLISFLFVTLCLSTGCVSDRWHQAGKSAEETRADLAQCKKWVKAADVAFTIDSNKTKSELVDECMRLKGYSETGETNSTSQ